MVSWYGICMLGSDGVDYVVCLSTLMFVTSHRLITKSSEKKVSRVFYLLPGTVAGGVGSVSGGAVPRFSRNSRRRRESCDGAVLFSDVFMTHNGTFILFFLTSKWKAVQEKLFIQNSLRKRKEKRKRSWQRERVFMFCYFERNFPTQRKEIKQVVKEKKKNFENSFFFHHLNFVCFFNSFKKFYFIVLVAKGKRRKNHRRA